MYRQILVVVRESAALGENFSKSEYLLKWSDLAGSANRNRNVPSFVKLFKKKGMAKSA